MTKRKAAHSLHDLFVSSKALIIPVVQRHRRHAWLKVLLDKRWHHNSARHHPPGGGVETCLHVFLWIYIAGWWLGKNPSEKY